MNTSFARKLAFIALLIGGALILGACGGAKTVPTPTTQPQGAQLQATPTPPPTFTPASDLQFGPIVGPNYTPAPLHTPLPSSVSARPCRVQIAAAQVALRNAPNVAAPAIGTAFEREWLNVLEVTTDTSGVLWVHTAAGWLPLNENGVTTAQLETVWACDVLTGRTPWRTLAGLHIINDTRHDEVLSFVRLMRDSGIPVGTVKGLNGTEGLLDEIKRISPETVIVYRSLHNSEGDRDCPAPYEQLQDPNHLPDPVSLAQRWYAGYKGYWDQVNADYYEYINECTPSAEWLAQFSIEMMRLANEEGRCLLLFSFSGGHPEMDEFDALLPAYRYAVEQPCQPGRTHGIALHAYSAADDQPASESGVWLARRHRLMHERLLATLPEAANLPVYITEMGIGGGTIMPPCELIIRDVLQYTYQLEADPYVKGFHLWSVGTGAQWYDVAPCLPDLSASLIQYYQSAPTHP